MPVSIACDKQWTIVVAKQNTTTIVVSSLNPSNWGDLVNYTATVTAAISGTPSGQVQFSDDSGLLGVSPLVAGVAVLNNIVQPAGSHPVVATYLGDGAYNASNGSVTQVVVGSTLTCADGPAYWNGTCGTIFGTVLAQTSPSDYQSAGIDWMHLFFFPGNGWFMFFQSGTNGNSALYFMVQPGPIGSPLGTYVWNGGNVCPFVPLNLPTITVT